MSEINIGDAALAGLRMMGRRPLAVLCWGLVMAAYVAVIFLLFGSGVAASITSMVQSTSAGGQPTPNQVVGLVGSLFGFFFFLLIGTQLLDLVFRAAAIRAELEPQARGFAYMRFGAEEAWLLATSFVFWLVLLIANIIMSIPLTMITFMAALGSAAAAGDPTHNMGLFVGLGGVRLLGNLIILAVSVWLWLRLSFGVILTYQQKQFRLFEGWTASRGHVWRMFLTMLLVSLMLFALGVILWIIAIAVFVGTVAASAAGIAADPRAFFSQPPAVWLAALTPLLVVMLISVVVTVSATNAMIWGAVARMWDQLYPEADAAKAFT